jgi:hypothetical protein
VSSGGNDFKYDFQVTVHKASTPVMENFLLEKSHNAAGKKYDITGEQPCVSVLKLWDGRVYHSYSMYRRFENPAVKYRFLDLTPTGRLEGSSEPAEFKMPAEYEEEWQRMLTCLRRIWVRSSFGSGSEVLQVKDHPFHDVEMNSFCVFSPFVPQLCSWWS